MRKLLMLLSLAVIGVMAVAAPEKENRAQLKAAHLQAIQYHGHVLLLADKKHKMDWIFCKYQTTGHICYNQEMASGYLEYKHLQLYWTIEKIAHGNKVTFYGKWKSGEEHIRTYLVSKQEDSVRIKDLNWQEDASRLRFNWNCVRFPMIGCLSCTDFPCWLEHSASLLLRCGKWD